MQCPVCSRAANPRELECECGEVLAPWRLIATHGQALRHRGLVLAAREDYLGACLAFLEAALGNPLDESSLLDAARSLFRLGRVKQARRLLAAASGGSAGQARRLAAAIDAALAEQSAGRDDAAAELAAAGEEETAARPATARANADGTRYSTRSSPDESPSAQPPRGTRRPLLALGPVTRSPGLFRFLARNGHDPMWEAVLSVEAEWDGDWSALDPWLEAVSRRPEQPGVLSYMRGLTCWGREARDEARGHFAACLAGPVDYLNPAAYFLSLHLDDAREAADVFDRLCEQYSPREMEQLLPLLRERFLAWKDAGAARAVERLQYKARQ
jgi:hypothetical protein